jgi:hypothetical protein
VAPLQATRLSRLARRSSEQAAAGAQGDGLERCELCHELIAPEHRHLVAVDSRELLCACRACTILFDNPAASAGRYKLIPERRLRLEAFQLDDAQWEELRIPVEMAFFFHSSPAGRVVAFYPSPAGATESALELEAWRGLAATNAVLDELEPDVEALLVNRAAGPRGHWIVPIDVCYALVGLIRGGWQGLSGGAQVWEDLERFFADLERRARTVSARSQTAQANAAAATSAGGREG